MNRAACSLALTSALTVLATFAAHAQVYKCTVGGKVAYSQTPCERGTETVLVTPATPAPGPDAAKDLQRMQRESARLERERHKREALQEREDARLDRAAGVRRQKCEKLRLARKWADDDVRRASPQAVDAARLKASRAAERLAVECPA